MKGKIIMAFLVTTLMLSGAFVNGADVKINNNKDGGSRGDTLNSYTTSSSASDGYITACYGSYSGAHDAATGTVFYTYEFLDVGQQYLHVANLNFYSIWRSYVYFDTSGIPADATITSATLSLYCNFKLMDQNNYDVVIQNGQPSHPSEPTLQSGDYNKNYYSGNGGSINYYDIVENSYNPISINPDDLGWINKGSGAITKLCLRSSNDIDNIAIQPTQNLIQDAVNFSSSESSNAPQLTVEYTPNQPPYMPNNPFPADGATNVNVDTVLTWSGGDPDGDSVTYDVYFGTSYPPPQVAWDQSDLSYNPGTMNHDTKYYWKIVATDEHGVSTIGPIWSFTTVAGPPPTYTVYFQTDPQNTGTITFNGATKYDGDSVSVNGGSYSISCTPPSDYKFSFWTSSCGTVKDPKLDTTSVTVSKSGTLEVHFIKKENYYFIHLTDVHAGAMYGQIDEGTTRLAATLNHIRTFNPKPKFIVISGDIADTGDLLSYQRFKSCFYGTSSQLYLDSGLTIPVYIIPGNHDSRWTNTLVVYDTAFDYPEGNDHCYLRQYSNTNILSVYTGGDCINPADWIPQWTGWAPPEGTGLSQDDINWLTDTLSNNNEWNKNNIIFMHHPAMNKIDGNWGDGCIRSRIDDFLELCSAYHASLVLSGHTHGDWWPLAYQYISGQKDDHVKIYTDSNGLHYYLTNGSAGTYDRTLNIQTPSVLESYAFRNISIVNGDEIRAYYYDYAEETSTGDLIWNTGGGKGDGPLADLTIEGGSKGSDIYVIDLVDLANQVYGKKGSFKCDQDACTYVIHGLASGSVDFNCKHYLGKSKGEITVYYKDVPVQLGWIEKLSVSQNYLDYQISIDTNGDGKSEYTKKPDKIVCADVPYIPGIPSGTDNGKPRKTYSYSASTNDPENDQVSYLFDWGDDTDSGWIGPFNSGQAGVASKSWKRTGTYYVKVKAKDIYGTESDWSEPLAVKIHRGGPRAVDVNPLFTWFLEHFPRINNMIEKLNPIIDRYLGQLG